MTKKELGNVRFWAHIHTIQLSIEAPLNHAEFGRKRYVKDYFIRNAQSPLNDVKMSDGERVKTPCK